VFEWVIGCPLAQWDVRSLGSRAQITLILGPIGVKATRGVVSTPGPAYTVRSGWASPQDRAFWGRALKYPPTLMCKFFNISILSVGADFSLRLNTRRCLRNRST
jgi:hypothetical protein